MKNLNEHAPAMSVAEARDCKSGPPEMQRHDTAISGAANALAANGWKLHPLHAGSKLPQWAGWQHRAAADASPWAADPLANIGAATGGGYFVLDVDCKDGAAGFASLADLQAANGQLPPTLTARTASGGLHLYFAAADAVRNSAGKLGAGLDVRGAGGYVVAPPSVIDGRAYSWQNLAPMAPAPDWLVRLAMDAAPVREHAGPAPAAIEASPELLADLQSALQSIPADGRDDWVSVGAALRALGDDGRALWVSWSAGSDKHNPDTDPDQWETFGHDTTAPAAIFAKAQRLGWDNPAALRRAAEVFGRQQIPPPAEPGLVPVDLTDVMTATLEPTRYSIAPLLPRGFVSLLGGHGGTGKSYLALVLGAHVAAGRDWAGFTVEQGPVLFVSLEDRGELARLRLRHVINAYGLDARAVAANMRVVDGTGGNAALMTEGAGSFGQRPMVTTSLFAELEHIVTGTALVIIDNASEGFEGSPNDNHQVRTFLRALAALGDLQPAICLLAHVDKASAKFGDMGNAYLGAVAWNNVPRSRLALTRDGSKGQLQQQKLNVGKQLDAPICLRWNDHGVPLPDLDATEAAAEAAGRSDADAVLEAIRAAITDGVNIGTGRGGGYSAQKVLEKLPDLPQHLHGTRGGQRFWGAVTALQRGGLIGVEEYKSSSRHTQKRYVINAAGLR